MSLRLLACALVCGAGLQAQSAGPSLHGLVHDPLGALVPNAHLELLENGAVIASATSSAEGAYALQVPFNHRFRIRVAATSFQTTLSEPLYLTTNGTEVMDLTLDTPTLSEQVTVTATGTPTPLAQTGAPITILTAAADYPYSPEVQQPLRLIPGVQITQVGQTGGASSLFVRGGESNATKVVLDGVPVSDVGGSVNLANLASLGIAQIEVHRQPNSALYGSDALAGVVSLSTVRGSTPLPLVTYAVDGGNLGFRRQEADVAGAYARVDYYTGFARLDTSNNIANNAFHNVTFAGNYGFAPDTRSDLRLAFRHLTTAGGQPSAISFYGIPDLANQKEQDSFLSATAERQTTLRWHNLVRYGHEALHSEYFDYAATGIPYTPDGATSINGYIGKPVVLRGANGYSVSGQALFQYPGTYPNTYRSQANRDFVYAQTDFRFNPHVTALGAYKYEAERGANQSQPSFSTAISAVDRRNSSYTLQVAGDLRSRLFYTLGSGIEKNAVFGTALTPRASLAFYAVRPARQGRLSGTKLHASFGKGIKESNVFQQNSSLFELLAPLPNGSGLISQYHIHRLGAEYSRNYDMGVEQQFGDGRARVNATWFHNEFTNGIQFLGKDALVQLGVPTAVAQATDFGAYVNSQAYRAEGAELEAEVRLSRRIFARAGYTYLDAEVQHSFSGDALAPSSNTSSNFANVLIGAYAPLIGARPFRRAPHTGYFALSYANSRLSTQLSGTLVGRRDDSTFLTDKDYGSSLLLPNRNLDGAYQRLELTADYRVTKRVTPYVNLQNVLNESYAEAFGYPALPFNLRGGVKFTFGGESWRLR